MPPTVRKYALVYSAVEASRADDEKSYAIVCHVLVNVINELWYTVGHEVFKTVVADDPVELDLFSVSIMDQKRPCDVATVD